MSELDTFDPTLFGDWPSDAGLGWSAAECRREAKSLVLETKADNPGEALRLLLNDLTREMRDEFDYFRRLRTTAETAGPAGEGGDEAAKLARADIKVAVDAISLIARTLEKIDSLQRQIARDRETEIERHADSPAYEDNKRRLLAIVEQRAEDRARAMLAERDRQQAAANSGAEDIDGPAAGHSIAANRDGTGPPGDPGFEPTGDG